MTLSGTWTHLITSDRLRRSSQVVTAIGDTVCIFGGEVVPRQPVDNQVDLITLKPDGPTLETKAISKAPPPRVGSASTLLGDRMYVFGGRGGKDMAPLDEEGTVWNYDPESAQWYELRPSTELPSPQPRSYHCAASNGESLMFISSGCPEQGRLSDIWMFDVFMRSWLQMPEAPAPPRGGASMAFINGKLYRMNGFDGRTELGGSIDIFDLILHHWSTETYLADGMEGPEPRSVAALRALSIGGRDKLITLFGERDPSTQGHEGAGKMLSDVWVYDIADKQWTNVECTGSNGVPDPRGWFDADVVKGPDGKDQIVVHGGLGENNERLGDVWLLSF